jgi:hypothetical protein
MEQAIERNPNNSNQQQPYQNKDIEDLIESNWISIKDGETRYCNSYQTNQRLSTKQTLAVLSLSIEN